MSTLTDAIYQNTAGNSQGYPLGVPTSWNWYQGWNPDGQLTPPSNFTAATGWGVVYPEAGAPADSNPSASVQIANFQTYVHLTSGAWVLVQNQSAEPITGAHYLADFSGSPSVAWNETTLSDGSASVDAPQSGYNDHFWPDQRGTYASGTVDGVFVEASMKTNDPNANLVAELGADWWLNSSAPSDDFANNPGAGSSDWVKLTTQYQSLYFTSLSPQELQADPPPGLQTTPPATTAPVTTPPATTPPAIDPAVTQATASPGTGVTVADPPATAGGSSPSQSGQGHDHDHSFALLSQHLAGGFHGSADAGQIATAASHAASWLNESILTRPQH
jgi:hypothetical protein